MALLPRLTRLFRKESTMRSASVMRRGGQYFVVTLHGSGGGDPCIASGPLEVLSVEAGDLELGAAVLRGLARTTHHHPYPASPQEWKQIGAPLLKAAKCRSWSAFAKGASDLRVDQTGGNMSFLPAARNERNDFVPVTERERQLQDPSAMQIGHLVATELEFALARDGG